MEDIEILKLENKALRIQNQALQDEVKILRRFRTLVGRAAEIVKGIPTAICAPTVITRAEP